MKQNNKFNKFKKNTSESSSICSCKNKAKLKSYKNYPFGKKSKAITTKYYKCGECGKIQFLEEKSMAKRR